MATTEDSHASLTVHLRLHGDTVLAKRTESVSANGVNCSILATSKGYLVVTHAGDSFTLLAGPFPGGTLSAMTWVLVYAGQFALRGLSPRDVARELRAVTGPIARNALTGREAADAIAEAISSRARPTMTSADALNQTKLGRLLIFAPDRSRSVFVASTDSAVRAKRTRYLTGPKTPTIERAAPATAQELRANAAKAMLVQRGQMLEKLKRADRRPHGRKMSAKDLPPIRGLGDET